jgi:hypothetical protein
VGPNTKKKFEIDFEATPLASSKVNKITEFKQTDYEDFMTTLAGA